MFREKCKLSASIMIILVTIISVITILEIGNKDTRNVPFNNIVQQSYEKIGSKSNLAKDKEAKRIDTPEQKNTINDGVVANEDRNSGQSKKRFENIEVKAIYLTGVSAGNNKVIDHVIELANTTELNAVVIDVKEAGVVNYKSEVPEVKNNKLYTSYYDVDSVIKKLHDNNIYVIARIVCFRDNGLATKRADLAIKKPDGKLWKEGKLGAWTNPFNKEVWKYNIDIAKEAIDKGFDEIQFDYVRFPTTREGEVEYRDTGMSKVDAISGFLEFASKELREKKGAVVSADVFGIICESRRDGEAIGQDLEKIGMHIDYICPMVYPSHYANASNGVMGNGYGQMINGVLFKAPDLKPYEVVYNTLLRAKERISKVEGYRANVRPYLQDFTASYIKNKKYYQEYGPVQVRQQIKAVYDAGYKEWILWNGHNVYSEGALLKEKQ